MIDIHSHLIPAFDDGSRSVEQSGTVLRMFEQHGVQHVVLTPHVLASELATSTEEMVRRRDAAFAPLSRLRFSPELQLSLSEAVGFSMRGLVVGNKDVLERFRELDVETFFEAGGGEARCFDGRSFQPLVEKGNQAVIPGTRQDELPVDGSASLRGLGTRYQVMHERELC